MNTLQIEDVFEPYYVGRKPFLAPKPVDKGNDSRAKLEEQADAKADSSVTKDDAVTEH